MALRLQQGEIVGLLGPNGAGKTTTFYMIVGLIEPLAGQIVLDGADITSMPMYKRARRGIGYLSQEPSIFRKLSVEDNILAILETLDLSASERRTRLETLLDELSIKHLRHNKAFALSGGERRRLEITRALVTQPKFMMLDEPFAGVDPIAVHDIQQIVGNLRHRGIGVLISDHNVEQTLDIVDRAYIMFDGQVKVSGTVRELVFDDTVADIYLGPTLTARLRARFAAADRRGTDRPHESRAFPEHAAQAGAQDQSTPVSGDGSALHAAAGPAAAPQAGAAEQPVPRHGRARGGRGRGVRGRGGVEAETDAEEEKASNDEIDWEEILLDGFDAGGRREEHEEREYYEPVTVDTRDLSDHLIDQIALLDLTPRQQLLADEFIGNINEDGYLACPLDESSRASTTTSSRPPRRLERDIEDLPLYTHDEVEEMLAIDPEPRPAGRRRARPARVPHAPAPRGGARAVGAVPPRARLLRRVDQPPLERDLQALRHQPGRRAEAPPTRSRSSTPSRASSTRDASDNYIIPDLIVEKIDGKYHVFLNDANLPRLKLSRAYQEIARDKKKFEGENKEFISNKLNSANWMIQAIEQRRQTMLKVMNYIVDRQRDFFEKGVQYLKPLTLREVAEVISMHESTVSRVTNEKFVQTPRGVLPLKFFFSSGLSTTAGEDVSARGIKAQIEKLVAEEDPKHPLTDQAIVNILKEGGVQIARRTVAKYRDQLGVLSARMRKRV